MAPLLEVCNLHTRFRTREATAMAVDGVSFSVEAGKTLGLVGESGCGKSVTALSILRLVPEPHGEIAGGKILLQGRELLALTEREMRHVRGARISMIFQEPMTSLNPTHTAGAQVAEVYRLHRGMGRREASQAAVEMLARVQIPDAPRRARQYPHEMSGGMRQRVMIAMALACGPDLLIADEPTTALDVTIQAQILELMRRLQEEMGTAVLIISHDLGVIAETADEVAVMYAGMIAERASATALFARPLHPYTRALLRSIPQLDRVSLGRKIQAIPGQPPNPARYPQGCRFHPRCPFMTPDCQAAVPALEEIEPGHHVRCIYPQRD
ncbi:MAG: ABC transporter ATP-binding protein [Candidatus Sumerlaeota bacterium]|nr:ABC transporter ATP-binding protein [Candidatus Sumerlaeota bacterium]